MPSIFCRDPRPSYWNPGVLASPNPDYTLRDIYVRALALALPPALERYLIKRFLLKRQPAASSETPPAPNLYREPFAPGSLGNLADAKLCNEITLESELIDRTLRLPEGVVSGLSRHHLLALHLTRMRQLWAEFSRRRWPGGWLPAYRRALGLDFTPGLQGQQS